MPRPLRIIVPNFYFEDSFVDNVVHALREMGHEVRTAPRRSTQRSLSPVRIATGFAIQKLFPDRLPPAEKWLLKEIKTYRADVLLALTQQFSEETLREVRRSGVGVRVAWWGDTPANMRRMGLLTPEWDAIFLKDPDGVKKFRRVGLNAHLLHEAMNPAWHRPVAKSRNPSVAIVGNFYGFRQYLAARLLDDGFPLAMYGPPVSRWCHPEIRRLHTGRYIVREEKSRVFGESVASLNSTDLSEGNSLNCRAFEIAGAGGLQLIERRTIIEECFVPGKELLVFDSYEELAEHVRWAERFPGEADRIREAAARRALAEHTYQHRIRRILEECGLP